MQRPGSFDLTPIFQHQLVNDCSNVAGKKSLYEAQTPVKLGQGHEVTEPWTGNEEQMLMGLKRPNKTYWFVMQNIAFERHLNDYFVPEFRLLLVFFKGSIWRWRPLTTCETCKVQIFITESWFWFAISNMLIKNTRMMDLFPLPFSNHIPIHTHARAQDGGRGVLMHQGEYCIWPTELRVTSVD